MNFERLFKMGLDRELPGLLEAPPGLSIGLGENWSGKGYGDDQRLGLPNWHCRDKIPAEDETVGIIHAYHFLEHLSGEEVIALLYEIQRVLVNDGILQFCIPWAKAEIAFQDLTHKSFWTESSFRMLMRNPYYEPIPGAPKWKLHQHYLVIAGIVERNLCLLGQLVKRQP